MSVFTRQVSVDEYAAVYSHLGNFFFLHILFSFNTCFAMRDFI
jgi:hypothetical protein